MAALAHLPVQARFPTVSRASRAPTRVGAALRPFSTAFAPASLESSTSRFASEGRAVLVLSRDTSCEARVTCSLPHARWSARAIKSFSMAELEARKLKYPTTGTEALLMGMLTEGTGYAARFLRSHGVKLLALRAATVELLGKADMYFFSPEHPPLTQPAQAVLDWAVARHAELGGEGEIGTELILLGIWQQQESAGHKLLSTLGFTDALAQQLADEIEPVKAQ